MSDEAIARKYSMDNPTKWKRLEITINLSNLKKDPREIAAAGGRCGCKTTVMRESQGPQRPRKPHNVRREIPRLASCVLKNEGYRDEALLLLLGLNRLVKTCIIPIELGGERWGLNTAHTRTLPNIASP